MKSRHPIYSILSCLLGNRTTRWLLSLVVMAITLTFLNGYALYKSSPQTGTETPQTGSETAERNKMETDKSLRLWIYHSTVWE